MVLLRITSWQRNMVSVFDEITNLADKRNYENVPIFERHYKTQIRTI